MTVRVERTIDLPAPPEDVWAFIADPEKRARAIGVVREFERTGERTARWRIELPIPLLDRTVAVDTEEVARREGEYVSFVGESRVVDVQGEHELEPLAEGTRLVNRFVVEGRLPGVERYFRRNLDAELDNLEAALREELGVEA
jgi:carbon monoxide dehydrogenase subunit G